MSDEDNQEILAGATDEKKPSKRAAPSKAEKSKRSEELCHDDKMRDAAVSLYAEIEEGFDNQNERYNDTKDYWDLFNCILGPKQMYNGNSAIFVPAIYDAIEARQTRFTNQVFPQAGRYVECISEDDTLPNALTSLLDHYVRQAKLRTVVIPALFRSGDVEGHYHLYTGWQEIERTVAFRTSKPIEIDGEEFDDPDLNVDTVEEQDVITGRPYAEVISDADVLVLPTTADSVDEAIEMGGSVTILRRWSRSYVENLIAKKKIDKENGETFLSEMSDVEDDSSKQKDISKRAVNAAGIQEAQRGVCGLVYETWTLLKFPDGKRRLGRIFYAGNTGPEVLSLRRCPYWNDKVPLVSAPVKKLHGVFKGKSLVAPVATMQIQANDAVNMGMDSAGYSLMPIIMTDPEKNPRVGSMILALAAIWETNPNDTKFAEFPQLWKEAMEIVTLCRGAIMGTLSVNPSQVPQGTARKPTQAEVAQEQQVDLLSTSDSVTVLEEGILTPLVQRWIEYDHQFRDEDLTVMEFGELGVKAQMKPIEPIQFDKHYMFRWMGSEVTKEAQQIQQQIAAINVVRGIPPQQYQGYELKLGPAIARLIENAMGPRLAQMTFVDQREALEQQPELENEILAGGMWMPVNPSDDDAKHIQSHVQLMQGLMQQGQGDPSGALRNHITAHQMQAQQKMMAQQQAGQPMPGLPPPGQGGEPGEPGGAGPGMSGTPRMGAMPGQATGGQGPPGMIPHDAIQSPGRVPRPQ